MKQTTAICQAYKDHEIWKDIKGYEGMYQISNYGRIKSLERVFLKFKRGRKEKMEVYLPEKIRSIGNNNKSYPKISLWRNGKVDWRLIHRLVAQHFIDNPMNYNQVLHKDDNPRNYHWSNLEWGTQSKNIKDAVERGRWHIGAKNNKSKLKDHQIPEIRELIKKGISCCKIAPQFNISVNQILGIKNNKIWKHIK